jgi:hypothetical protein
MCVLMLKTVGMASPGEKIALVLNAQSPPWSQPYLARLMAGQLGLTERQWLDRIKNYVGGRTPPPIENLEKIAAITGADVDWLAVEDDQPVKWRRRIGNIASFALDGSEGNRQVAYLGYVPAYNFVMPERGLERTVTIDYSGPDDVRCVTIRSQVLAPVLKPGTKVVCRISDTPVPDVLNLALSPEGTLMMGQIKRVEQGWLMEFCGEDYPPQVVTDWSFLGYAVYAQQEAPEGLTL